MKNAVKDLYSGDLPFCCIQKQDNDEILVLTGNAHHFRNLNDLPRTSKIGTGKLQYDTISVVPFCQIRERGYTVHDGGELILTIQISSQKEIDKQEFLNSISHRQVSFEQGIEYDTTEDEYKRLIENILKDEIGNGEGANFVVPRNATGKMKDFSVAHALSIYSSLLENDYGTYWKFLFYDGQRFFIGSTPERHLYVKGGQVKMNPISGTFRKEKRPKKRKEMKKELLGFLTDPKEINELFMVVDEELKMMARMCEIGGAVYGPSLKEMSRLIHSEYLLVGESSKDLMELFGDSMFAATVVGSPVESACRVVAKYSESSRRYYGSAMMLIGRDEEGEEFLDSPITIRTAEIDLEGNAHFSVGATLVRDSVPADEIMETKAKSAGIIDAITKGNDTDLSPPIMTTLANDDEIIETLARRNMNLSSFWFYRQSCNTVVGEGLHLTLIHNEDDFVYMLRHMLAHLGHRVSIIGFREYDMNRDTSDITMVGPGPGNPNQNSEKVNINCKIAEALLAAKKPSLFICLGHQILCKTLGLKICRKSSPLQGAQVKINLFGREELVGFYNTFTALTSESDGMYEIASVPESKEVVAIRSLHFIGYQFHPESILTQNGYSILQESINYIINKA